jgi:uncharacterized protein YbjT (DUF2867 family)
MEKKIVIVVGATGTLGMEIVKALIAGGASVRAMVRPTSNRSKLEKLGVSDFVTGDMMDPASLNLALAASPRPDAVISSAAGYTGHTKGDNAKTDTQGYKNLVDAAKAAGIPRFVLISILECDKAAEVPHFYHKYLVEKYLAEKGQPFIALRAGAFLDQTKDFVLPKVQKGIFPELVPGVALGMIYTPDLAKYAAIAATSLPESALGSTVDVGWKTPATGHSLAKAFSEVLGKSVVSKPAFPPVATYIVMPIASLFNQGLKDIYLMYKWIQKGMYISKNPGKQMELFGELPTLEEAVKRYCNDKGLV